MAIKPLSDRVLVQRIESENKTASGLYIPDTAKEKPLEGIVRAAGPGNGDRALQVKEGDKVLFGKYSGTEISVNGVEHLILREEEILAIVTE